jgi:hypothetical protein
MFYELLIKVQEKKAIPYVCETSKFPHFLDNRLTDGGHVILTRRPHFTPQEETGAVVRLEELSILKNAVT